MKKFDRIGFILLSVFCVMILFCGVSQAASKKPVISKVQFSISDGVTTKKVTDKTLFQKNNKLIVSAKINPNGTKIRNLFVYIQSTSFPGSARFTYATPKKGTNTYTFTIPMRNLFCPVKGEYEVVLTVKPGVSKTIGKIKLGFGAEVFEPGTMTLSTPVFEKTVVAPGEDLDVHYSVTLTGAVPENYNEVEKLSICFYQNGKLIDSDDSLEIWDDNYVVTIPDEAKAGELTVKTKAIDRAGNRKWSPATVLTVVDSDVKSIRFTKKSFAVEVGLKKLDIDDLFLRVKPEGVTHDFYWGSSNEDVATVENGLLTAKSKGTCVITCKVPNSKLSASMKIIVK